MQYMLLDLSYLTSPPTAPLLRLVGAFATLRVRQCSSAVEQQTHKLLVGGSNPPTATPKSCIYWPNG